MKKYLLILVLLGFIFSCKKETAGSSMTVSGQVKGLKKGTLYLQHIPDSMLVNLDSLEIRGDGSFSFATQIESPEIFYLYLDKEDNNVINDRIRFFGEAGEITINTTWNSFDAKAEISGSETHEKLEEYLKMMSRYNAKNLEILQAANSPDVQNDPQAMDSIQKASERNIRRGYLYALNFAMNNKDSYISPYIAVKEVPDAGLGILDSIYNSLSPEVAGSKYGKELKQLLENRSGE